MSKSVIKSSKNPSLKTKIINTLMISGKKFTGEKILLKSAKKLQKSTGKSFKSLVHLAVINTTPAFKVNEQIVKRGKRKTIRSTFSFITADSLRVMASLKFIRSAVNKSKGTVHFYERFTSEILSAAALKGSSVDKKNTVQEQALLNKRYLFKFRW